MVLDLDEVFAKLNNPRMTAGLMVLHSLLCNLQGEPVEPRKVRESVDELMSKRDVSKQSITNAARRLEEANIIDRKDNKYAVNYGYLISILLNILLDLNKKVLDLEEELLVMKTTSR